MKHTEVITKYLEALRSGSTDEHAQLVANNWAEAMELHPQSATKQDLKNLESDLKLFFVYLVGSALFLSLFVPILQRYFGLN
jgi:hypothetical protein